MLLRPLLYNKSMPRKWWLHRVQPVSEQKRRRRKQAPHYSVDRKFFDAVRAGRSETLHDEDRFRALVPHLILEKKSTPNQGQ